MLLVSLAALTACAQTATVIDPQGDAFYSKRDEAPAFLDILAASFTISDTLTFTVDVAGSLDALPNPPQSHGLFDWHFSLNTDDSTDPPGLPAPSRANGSAEFYVGALWDAHHHHSASDVGCADTGSGCAARHDLELHHAPE